MPRSCLCSASATLLLSAAVDFGIEGPFNAVNQVSIISRGSVLDFDDRARLLVDFLGEVSLGHLRSHARVLDRLGADVRNHLELDLLVQAIIAKIVVRHVARVVVDFLLLGRGRRWPAVSAAWLSDGAGNEDVLTLLATELLWLVGPTSLLGLRLLVWLLHFCPIAVHTECAFCFR